MLLNLSDETGSDMQSQFANKAAEMQEIVK